MAETAIHEAARRGDVESLRRELAAGISPNLRTPVNHTLRFGGRTPLHLCFSAGGERIPECCRVLIAAGADVNARDVRGQMPIHYVASQPVVAERFNESDSKQALEALEFLLGSGADVNATDYGISMTDYRWTPLHCAAWYGFADAIEPLIRAGALVNERDARNMMPLDYYISPRGYWYGFSVDRKSRIYPLFLQAGAELRLNADLPTQTDVPYLQAVIDAGGFKKYAERHLATITALFARTERLPPEMVRHVVSYWLHAGYYVY